MMVFVLGGITRAEISAL